MAAYKLRILIPAVFLTLVMVVWIAISGEAYGETLYEYIDKDGSVVITDNPPPGVKAVPKQSLPDITIEQKSESEKESEAKMQKYREADVKRTEKEEKIRAAREELERAKSDAESYRSNMNQSANYSQRHHWRMQVDEQDKLVEDLKKKLDELESGP